MKRLFVFALVCCVPIAFHFSGCSKPSPSQEVKVEKATEKIGDASIHQESALPDKSIAEEKATADVYSDRAIKDQSNPPEPSTEQKTDKQSPEATAEQAPPDQGNPRQAITKLCAEVSKFQCKPLAGCCKGLPLRFKNKQECEVQSTAKCVQGFQSMMPGLQSGDLIINAIYRKKCLAALASAANKCLSPSPQIKGFMKYCQGMFQDKAKLNKPCSPLKGRFACADGSGICNGSSLQNRVCSPWKKQGDRCTVGLCEQGLICTTKPTEKERFCNKPRAQGAVCVQASECEKGLICLKNKCEKPLKEGEACSRRGQCESSLACHLGQRKCVKRVAPKAACEAHDQCPQNYKCIGLRRIGLCTEPSKKGEACRNANQCAKGLYCSKQICVTRFKLGDACRGSEECIESFACDPMTSKCVTLPTEGKSCLMGPLRCAKPLTCFSSQKGQGICKNPVGEGKTCTQGNNCLSGLGCDMKKSECVKLPKIGGKCFNNYLCSEGYCDHRSGLCKAFQPTGGSCRVGNECGPKGACVQKGSKTLVCVPIPQKGESCLLHCAKGLFCKQGLKKGTCHTEVCLQAAK